MNGKTDCHTHQKGDAFRYLDLYIYLPRLILLLPSYKPDYDPPFGNYEILDTSPFTPPDDKTNLKDNELSK